MRACMWRGDKQTGTVFLAIGPHLPTAMPPTHSNRNADKAKGVQTPQPYLIESLGAGFQKSGALVILQINETGWLAVREPSISIF